MINYLRDSIKNAVNTFVFVLLFVVALCCSVTTSYAQAFKWETVKHNSAEYVTLRSVKEFYRFDRMKVGAKVSLENVATKIEFKSGSQNCYMNGVLFQLNSRLLPNYPADPQALKHLLQDYYSGYSMQNYQSENHHCCCSALSP